MGNVAWAHVVALYALLARHRRHTAGGGGGAGGEDGDGGNTGAGNGGGTGGGETYFITDDTPLLHTYAFMEQFLAVCGLGLAGKASSYRLVYSLMFLTENTLRAIAPIYKVRR